jgi:hypothetical protein
VDRNGLWLSKAREAALAGATVVALIPARTDTKWWHGIVTAASEIRYLPGRWRFGGCKHSAPFPSAVAFGGRPRPPLAHRKDGHGTMLTTLIILSRKMVLGFIVFWPIGLGVLAWKFWQKKSGYPGDIISFGREKWGNWANWTRGSDRWGFSVKTASGFGMGSTGNRAFDEWRATELARLEEERQKLVAAEREFAEFMENLRHARDREEFERFMDEHRNQQGRPSGQ